jgi:hypothetical protein
MSEPTKPGYYWAKRLHCGGWEVVRLWVSVRRGFEVLLVGTDISESADQFTFGPEVTKPEGLE